MSTTAENGKYLVTNLYDVDYLLDENHIVILQGDRAPSVQDMEAVARRYNELAALRKAANGLLVALTKATVYAPNVAKAAAALREALKGESK